MASNPSVFDLPDLETIARVYKAASVALVTREPLDSAAKEAARKNLRGRLLALAQPGSVEFDKLYEQVMSTYDAPTPQ
jgi:hypothetical protein